MIEDEATYTDEYQFAAVFRRTTPGRWIRVWLALTFPDQSGEAYDIAHDRLIYFRSAREASIANHHWRDQILYLERVG